MLMILLEGLDEFDHAGSATDSLQLTVGGRRTRRALLKRVAAGRWARDRFMSSDALRERYANLGNDELQAIAVSGGLTDEARELLQ
jgi:hypothetical protein